MKRSLSAGDLASLLAVSSRTLRRWEEDGSGPKRVIENLEPVYPLETLVPWLKKHHPQVKLGEAAEVDSKASRLALLEAWERLLCKRYGLESTEVLYEALRHADFHNTGSGAGKSDELKHWNLAAYAAFSGTMVRHRLSPERLKDLRGTFESRRDLGVAKKKNLSAAEFSEQIEEALTEEGWDAITKDVSDMRQIRDHLAIAHKYACAITQKYYPPPGNPNVMEDLAALDQRGG